MLKTGKFLNLFVLAHAQPVLARAQPVPACMPRLCSVPEIQFWEGVTFLQLLQKNCAFWFEMPQIGNIWNFEICGS